MYNHRSKLLVIVCLVIWSLAGTHVAWSQMATHSAGNVSDAQYKLHRLAAKFKKRAIANKSAAVKKAYIYGWPITTELAGGGFRELQRVGPDGTPLYKETHNDMVVKTTRTDYLSDGGAFDFGVDGTEMTIGIWDSGKAMPDHQEFGGRVLPGDNSPRVSGHATHVMGTALASGVDPKARGVASNATGLSFDWNNDEGEVAEQAAEGLLVSNHSYGLSGRNLPDWYFGSYIYQAQDWDEIMHAAPYYLMVTAAGNTRYLNYNDNPVTGTAKDGYDLLIGFAVSKNGITVAAADNITIGDNGDLISTGIASFSNFGPTDDGRIKPDITGAGVDVYSSYDRDTDNYRIMSGTSMASPGVASSLLLLQQYHYVAFGNYMRAATVKGLALHTADEAGDHPGPDPKFGWGVLNAKRAAEALDAKGVNSRIEEGSLSQGGEYAIRVTARSGEVLSASLSWTDPAYPERMHGRINNSTPVLVNDLDIRIYKDDEEYYPWKLVLSDLQNGAVKGDNVVDPFEKIEIEGAEGEYTIVITHKGQLSGTAQDFSLIVTGITESECSVAAPENTLVSEIGQVSASVTWDVVDEAFYEIHYKKEADEQWSTMLAADNSVQLENLLPDTRYMVQVRSLCSEIMGSGFSEPVLFTTAPTDPEEETPPGNQENGQGGNTESGTGGDTNTGGSDTTGGTDTGTGDGNTTGGTDNGGDTSTGDGGTTGGSDTTGGTDTGTGDGNTTGGTDNGGDTSTGDGGTTGGSDTTGGTDTGTGDGNTTGGTDNGGDTSTGDGGTTGGSDTTGGTDTGTGDGNTTGGTDNGGDTSTGDGGTTGGSDTTGGTDTGTGGDEGNTGGSYPDTGVGGQPLLPEIDGPPMLETPEDQVGGNAGTGDGHYGDTADDSLIPEDDPNLVWTPSGDAVVIIGKNKPYGPYYLVDMLGRILLTGNDASVPIHVSGLSKGVYILAFEYDGKMLVKKFGK